MDPYAGMGSAEKISEGRYRVIRTAFWWRVKIGDGQQTVGRCYTEAEAERLAAALRTAFLDGAFVVEKRIAELERENERLRSIVRKGRDAYSAYGILVTLPGHAMYSEAGAKLRSEWLRETDEYLREIDQAREKG